MRLVAGDAIKRSEMHEETPSHNWLVTAFCKRTSMNKPTNYGYCEPWISDGGQNVLALLTWAVGHGLGLCITCNYNESGRFDLATNSFLVRIVTVQNLIGASLTRSFFPVIRNALLLSVADNNVNTETTDSHRRCRRVIYRNTVLCLLSLNSLRVCTAQFPSHFNN